MRSRLLTVLLLFHWGLSAGNAAEPQPAAAERALSFPKPQESAALLWKSGYAAVRARINGQDAMFGLTPFTEFSLITEKSARRLGVEKLKDYDSVALAGNFEVAGAVSRNEPLVIEPVDLGELDGIIGHSFLREFAVRADLGGGRLTLYPPDGLPPADSMRGAVFPMEIRESEVAFSGTAVTARRGTFVISARTAGGVELPFALHFFTDTNLSIPETVLKQKLPHVPVDADQAAVLPELTDGHITLKLGRFLVLPESQPRFSQEFGILAGGEISPLEFVLDYRNQRVRITARLSSVSLPQAGISLRHEAAGWTVDGIEENSAAVRAGIIKGDRLLSLDGTDCAGLSADKLAEVVGKVRDPALRFTRTGEDGGVRTLDLTLEISDAWPEDPGIRGHLRRASLSGDAGETVIPAETFLGLLIVPAQVNGVPVRLMVDTGCSATVVDSVIAAKAGLTGFKSVNILNAAGESVPMTSAVASSLRVGGLSVTDEPVLMADIKREGLPVDGCLGAATLRDFTFILNWREKTLRIRKRGSIPPETGVIPLKLELRETATPPHSNPQRWRPVVFTAGLEVMGRPFPLMLDSGFNKTLILPAGLLKSALPDLAATLGPVVPGGSGPAGEVFSGRQLILPRFTLGNETVRDLGVMVSEWPAGILGSGILQHYEMAVDVEGGMAWLRPLGTLGSLKAGGTLGVQGGFRDGELVVLAVEPGGPAEKAGVRGGDALRFFNGFQVAGKTAEEVGVELRGYSPGDQVRIGVTRGGVDMEFPAVVKQK